MATRSLFDGNDGAERESRPRAGEPSSGGGKAAGGAPAALSVSELVIRLKGAIEPNFTSVWVAGEVADFRGVFGSGHAYFALKDAASTIKAKMWKSSLARLKFTLENGAAVLAHGSIDLWAPRGELSLIVDRMVPQGIGEAAAAFEKLRKKLLEEGLFAEERKRPIPTFPRAVGLVTSREGAAIRDFLRHLHERFPIRVVLLASAVQGESAPESVASAISQLSASAARLGLEALAVVRGGGGIEDLAAFNSEGVARAIAACSVPVVTGIGHEIDTTIADLVADRRAKTPTDAANVLVPDRRELRRELAHSWERLGESADRLLSELEVELDDLRGRALQSGPASKLGVLEREIASLARLLTGAAAQRPERFGGELERLRGRLQSSSPRLLVAEWQRRLEASHGALRAGARAGLAAAESALAGAAGRLEGASPVAILARGYSLARKVGESGLLVDARQVAVGDRIETRLSRGSLVSRIEAARADGEGP